LVLLQRNIYDARSHERKNLTTNVHPVSNVKISNISIFFMTHCFINHLTPNGHYMGRTARLTSRRYILYIYSTNIRAEYFKHAA